MGDVEPNMGKQQVGEAETNYFLLANELEDSVLPSSRLFNQALLTEVITSLSTRGTLDSNRLQYLGGSALKLCTALQISALHLDWPEGCLTIERDRILRNSALAKAALAAGLKKCIPTERLVGSQWIPSSIHELLTAPAAETGAASRKLVAVAAETLIGAAFVNGGIEEAHECVRVLLHEETWDNSAHCISKIVSDCATLDLKDIETSECINGFEVLERMTQHKFKDKSLLLEAITHASYQGLQENIVSYDRLEFLGDAVLDLIVLRKLSKHKNKFKHWQRLGVPAALVNGHMLSFLCMSYCLALENYHVIDTVGTSASDSEAQLCRHSVYLHDYMRMSDECLLSKQASLKRFEAQRPAIEAKLSSGQEYPWCELVSVRAHKSFGDIIESIIGALFLDSSGDLRVCERFLDALGVFRLMERLTDHNVDTRHPKTRLDILASAKKVAYKLTRLVREDGSEHSSCQVRVGGIQVAEVHECANKEEAEARGA